MKITIDKLTLEIGLTQVKTDWIVKEVLGGAVMNSVEVSTEAIELLKLLYTPVDFHSTFYVTTTRHLSDGSVLEPWTERLSLLECSDDIPTPIVTPRVKLVHNITARSDSGLVTFKVSTLKNFIGIHTHRASTWILRDSAGVTRYRKEYAEDEKLSISIPEELLSNRGVMTMECIQHSASQNKSFRGIIDILIDSTVMSDNITVWNYLPKNTLVTNTLNILSFEAIEGAQPEHVIKVRIDDKLVDNYIAHKLLYIDTYDVASGTIIDVEIIYKLLGTSGTTHEHNVNKSFTVIEKVSMDETNMVALDTANISLTLLSTLPSKILLDNTDTIMLNGGLVPILNKDRLSLELYGIEDNTLSRRYGEIALEDVGVGLTIIGQVRVRVIDNASLVVIYTYTNITDEVILAIKMFGITRNKYGSIFTENYSYFNMLGTVADVGPATRNMLINRIGENSFNWSDITGTHKGHWVYTKTEVDTNPTPIALYTKANGVDTPDAITAYIENGKFKILNQEQYGTFDGLTLPNIESFILVRRPNKDLLLLLTTATSTKTYKVAL